MTGQIVPGYKGRMSKSLDDVFGWWESIPAMAAAVGESHWTVQKWKTRERIPDTYWTSVIGAAKKIGKQLSADDLLLMHNPPKRPSASRAQACE